MTSQDFTRREITSVYADFLVELRGFEPMAIAGAVALSCLDDAR